MDRPTLQHDPASYRAAVDRKGMSEDEILCFLGKAARRDQVIFIVSPPKHQCLVGAAEVRHRLHQRVENRLEIDGRAADDLEHVSGSGLLLQRFLRSRVLACTSSNSRDVPNRDHGLVGESLQQRDLLVAERAHFDPAKQDCADRLTFPEHRDPKWCA